MRKSGRPIAVDLFAGAGGMSLGFEQAGFDVVAAVEIDPIHAAVHRFNFPNCAVLPKSVCGLSGDDIRKEAGIGNAKVHVVCGGAPCQGFSLIGHRALDDPRNKLVSDFVRIVKELDADYFVFENVKGLTVGRHKQFLEELIGAFEDKYRVVRKWEVLNAMHYSVPQDRQRLFLLGAKKGLALPKYPSRSQAKGKSWLLREASSPNCRDALGDLPNAEKYKELVKSDSVRAQDWGKPSEYARLLRCADNDGWRYGYRRGNWNPDLLTSSMRTDHSDISRRRFSDTTAGEVEPISRFFKLSPSGVSNTLRAGTDSARGAFTSPRPIHYRYPRCITVREMARLHGFPDWFRFHQTKWHGARQIGNAVPPPLAYAVASEVMKAIGRSPSIPSVVLELKDQWLLEMDMSKAAEFWNVENPIGRRDRKSGARKRKQIDIENERMDSDRLHV